MPAKKGNKVGAGAAKDTKKKASDKKPVPAAADKKPAGKKAGDKKPAADNTRKAEKAKKGAK